MWSRPSDSEVSVHSVDPTGKSYNLVLMVCRSRDAMNCVPSVLTNLAATKSDKLLLVVNEFGLVLRKQSPCELRMCCRRIYASKLTYHPS